MQVQYYTEKMPMKRVYYTGSDALLVGYALCYDRDNITATAKSAGLHLGSPALVLDAALTAGYENYGRHAYVEKPASGNLDDFAGVVASLPETGATPGTGPGWIDIIEPAAIGRGVLLYTDASCTIDVTLLGPVAASYAFGTNSGNLVAKAAQTVNRATTNGLVQAIMTAPGASGAATFSLHSRTAVQLPTASIWDNFPIDAMRKNPFLGSLFETDFTDGKAYPANKFGDTTGLITPGLPAQGELIFFSSADNDAAEAQWECPIDIAGAGRWAFEMRLKAEDDTTDVACWFVGLTLAQILIGDIQADNGATMTDGSWVGFNHDATATTAIDVHYRLTGQTLNEHDAAAAVFVNDTYLTLGLYYDGTDIQTFVNGVNLAAPILGTGDMDQADFPLAAIMVPTVALKGLNAADYDLTADWLRVAQLA